MPKKQKAKYSKTKAVKSIARERLGTPPASRVIAEKTAPARPRRKPQPADDDLA